MAVLLLTPSISSAVSLELRGGYADVNNNEGNLASGGMNVYLYEGQYLQLFLGGEYGKLKVDRSERWITYDGVTSTLKLDANIASVTFGGKVYLYTPKRWKPYISFEGSYGQWTYDWASSSFETPSGLVEVYSDDDSALATGLGLGIDVTVTKNFSLGIEGKMFNYAHHSNSKIYLKTPTGKIFSGVDPGYKGGFVLRGVSISARYYF